MKNRIIFLALSLMFTICSQAFCFQAEVTDISGNKYFEEVKKAIAEAKESINMVMFIIELPGNNNKNTKARQLVDELIEAKKRGVAVSVILDQNVDFVNRQAGSGWQAKIRSIRAYKLLKNAGIEVHYDHPTTYTHAKVLVIDKKSVVMGSTNWTEAALNKNIEVDALIGSEKMAESVLEYFKTIKIDEDIDKYLDNTGEVLSVKKQFLENAKFAPEMVKQSDERAFDIYLFLLKEAEEDPEGKLIFNYDTCAAFLGLDKQMDSLEYRRQIIKVLNKLQDEYGLIKFEPEFGKDAGITLIDHDAPEKDGDDSDGEYFELPLDYYKFGWNRILSMRAKFCYLINFLNAGESDTQPFWSKSVENLKAQFGNVGRDVIAKGMDELHRKNLIEVRYDDLDKDFKDRLPKMYKVLQPYDFEALLKKLKGIEDKYGKAEYEKARTYAEIVFEEYNPEVIEDIILKTQKYGEAKIKEAFDIVEKKNFDNPKRKYSYVTGILEN